MERDEDRIQRGGSRRDLAAAVGPEQFETVAAGDREGRYAVGGVQIADDLVRGPAADHGEAAVEPLRERADEVAQAFVHHDRVVAIGEFDQSAVEIEEQADRADVGIGRRRQRGGGGVVHRAPIGGGGVMGNVVGGAAHAFSAAAHLFRRDGG